MGVYRNYFHYSFKAKLFIILRILFEIISIEGISFLYLYLLLEYIPKLHIANYITIFFDSWESLYSCIILIASVIQAKTSKDCIRHLKIVDNIYKVDVKYTKTVYKGTVVSVTLVVLIWLTRVTMFVLRMVRSYSTIENENSLLFIIYNIHLVIQLYVDFKYFTETCVILVFTMILTIMLKYFDKEVNLMEKQIQNKQKSLRKEDTDYWLDINNHLASCGKQMNLLFNFQVYFRSIYIFNVFI